VVVVVLDLDAGRHGWHGHIVLLGRHCGFGVVLK
jgi:hypothetical protein